jgi:hypothetical protein
LDGYPPDQEWNNAEWHLTVAPFATIKKTQTICSNEKGRKENLETIDEFHRYLTEIGMHQRLYTQLPKGIAKWLHDDNGYEVEEIIEKQKEIG